MTNEEIRKNAEEYAYKHHRHRDGMATPRQTIHTMEMAYIHGAEDRQPEIDKAKEIIKQLLLLPYANNEEVYADVTSILDKAERFLKE